MSSLFSQYISWAHPLVTDWFVSRFGTPTEPQVEGWPHIVAGRTTLICAPTGSGKTLTAFLACIDRLVRKAAEGRLEDRTEVLYVSPLKALSNDIQKNLEGPLKEIQDLATSRGIEMQSIRTFVRTGDTLAPERRSMLKRPPHIVVTTPESLYILLTADKSRSMLRDVETVIVDEIHAVADDKRGAHLSLSLERLDAICRVRPTRIGLSATQKPLEDIAHFLTGSARPDPVIVNIGHARRLDVSVVVPAMPLGAVASNEMWDETYDRLAKMIEEHRSTIVFVNTRKLSERVALRLAERLGEEQVLAHHGSLSRKLRLDAEKKLKAGEMKALVATASLELGIDIGHVDLVCQIGSPRSIAVALQRIGRAGHWRGAIPRGRIFATTRDELFECAALVRAIKKGNLDRIIIPEAPLDVLAQQIVAACSMDEWHADELYQFVKGAYPYRHLERDTFDEIIAMLRQGFAGRSTRFGAYLHHDQVNNVLTARRGSKLISVTNGGTIPETGMYTAVAEPEGTTVGTLDEDFAVESNRGDIILLGSTSWRVRRIEPAAGRVVVEDAHGAPPNVPFWRGEAPSRTEELSAEVGSIRQSISAMLANTSPLDFEKHFASLRSAEGSAASPGKDVDEPLAQMRSAIGWLKEECNLSQSGAEQVVEYMLQGRAVLGAVPTQDLVIAERFFDESGGMQLIIHAPFGGRINKAWGLALRKRFCKSFNLELQAAATDDGLNISLSEQHSFPLADVFHFLSTVTVKDVLEQAVLASPIFQSRWRWDATRALALLRFQGGKKVPPQIQRMRAEDLLAKVFPDAAACQDNIAGDMRIPDHPLVNEVMKDALTEALDVDGLKRVLAGLESGTISALAVDTPMPSQFAHEILNANPYAYLDDAPLEERRARAVEMRRVLPDSVIAEVGRLDPAAIAQVSEEAWPDIRDANELHDFLLTVISLPADMTTVLLKTPEEAWLKYMEPLLAARRAGIATAGGTRLWFAAEKAAAFRAAYPQADIAIAPAELDLPFVEGDKATREMVSGWLQHSGPVSAEYLSALLRIPESDIDQALLHLESQGAILRGSFSDYAPGQTQWCERRLLSRIHRQTLGILRKQVEPVSAVQFMQWLTHWQRLAPGTQLSGERGLLEVIRQLQGFEIPASAWERDVLARRTKGYSVDLLDRLCMTGAVGWGRLSPHPAFLSPSESDNSEDDETTSRQAGLKRIIPTSAAPITFFIREDSDWMASRHNRHNIEDNTALSHAARQVHKFLSSRGASFFTDIVRGTNHLKSEVETALWELVTAGLVTADSFDNLRALIDPRRRAGQGSGRSARPRHSTGRWTLLYTDAPADRATGIEATVQMLLRRYGVLFRELIARESVVPTWRELLLMLRRMEDRGEVRGGRFVGGFLGEQFALPVALESLRAFRKAQRPPETVTFCAADPLNLTGIILPGERLPAISNRTLSLKDGMPLASTSDESSNERKSGI